MYYNYILAGSCDFPEFCREWEVARQPAEMPHRSAVHVHCVPVPYYILILYSIYYMLLITVYFHLFLFVLLEKKNPYSSFPSGCAKRVVFLSTHAVFLWTILSTTAHSEIYDI